MSDDLFLFLIKVILSALLFFLRLQSKLFSLHFFNFLVSGIFLSFIIDTDPLKLLNFIRNFIHLDLWRTKLINFSIHYRWIEDIIDFSPFIAFSSINNDEGLSTAIGSGSTTRSVDISITIQWNAVLNDICHGKIQSSCSNICWYQNVNVLWFFKSFQFRKTHLLLHMRMEIWCLVSQCLKEELNSLWNFDCVGKNNCFWFRWKTL